jgi:2-polyprenyl-3-methyl-5-hydroxy-6-metoxy-1,4-benzoquinol methylase
MHYKHTLAGGARYPEYSEYYVHYPLKESKFSSHYHFQRLAGSHNDILDIGCGEGFFAERIARAGNRVVGIDILPEAKQAASLLTYIQADLDQGLEPVIEALRGRSFDKVLLQDVLEHLRHPETLLQDCAGVLKPNGQLLVSVPNIANITVRLSLLFGRFQYAERGILDKTHVRFFTRRTAKLLLQDNGYEIQKSLVTIMPVELVLGIAADHPLMRALAQILNFFTRLLPGLLGYQCVYVATPVGSTRRSKPAVP